MATTLIIGNTINIKFLYESNGAFFDPYAQNPNNKLIVNCLHDDTGNYVLVTFYVTLKNNKDDNKVNDEGIPIKAKCTMKLYLEVNQNWTNTIILKS